jgi:hypothetical protein
VGEHLVAWCEARQVLADRGHDSGRLDPERQRRSTADVPASGPDELVPVANSGRSD